MDWNIDGPVTDQRFAVVHHPLAPHALAAPLHYHRNEDELSYVITGTLGALLGDDVVRAEPGTWGDLARFAEINTRYSLDMDFESVPRLCQRFGLTFPQL